MDKRPSDNWKDYLHDMQSLDKAANDSFNRYLKKYAKNDKSDNPRKEEFNDKFFIPGKFYTFLYTTQERPSKSRPVINRRPVILSLGQMVNESNGKIYETGIDFMLMPPKIRIFLLDQLYKFFKKDISENQKNINEGRKGKKMLSLNYEVSKKIFNKLGWQMAFSVYEKGNVASPVIYDYEDWITIIPLYTKSITGKQPKELYAEYIKKMTNPTEINIQDKMKSHSDRKKEEQLKKSSKDSKQSGSKK